MRTTRIILLLLAIALHIVVISMQVARIHRIERQIKNLDQILHQGKL